MSKHFLQWCLVTAFLATIAAAQQTSWPPAQPADVASASAVVKASYAAISGPPGQPLKLDRFQSLFSPEAQLISVRVHGGTAEAHRMTVNEFLAMLKQSVGADGHTEREISEQVESYGNVATIWSVYESGKTRTDPNTIRGVNSIQLMNDGKRWWITGAQWQHETAETPIPQRYLSGDTSSSPR